MRNTTSGRVYEEVQARIRRDGGPLVELEISWPNGNGGTEVYDPHTAGIVERAVKFNGGTIVSKRRIN